MKTYQAIFDKNKNKGVFAISLVENPAMEGLFIALSENELVQFKTVNEEQRILCGLVLEPNKPIYRNQNGEEFNIVFDEPTITELSHSFFKNNNQSNSTIEHSGRKVEGVTFVESWIVEDSEKDKSSVFGFSYPKGSWMATMKVDNDAIWENYVKTGKVQGFSIDAMLSLEEVNLKSEIKMSAETETSLVQLLKDLPNQISTALGLKKAEEVDVKMGSMPVADGSITVEWDGDTLTIGGAVWATATDGTRVPLPVGEYPLEDGTTLVVVEEGICAEVRPAATEEEMPAQMETVSESASNDSAMAKEIESAIKSILIKYSEMEKKVEDLQAEIVELSKQPASKGIKQPEVKVDFSKMTAKERIAATLKQTK